MDEWKSQEKLPAVEITDSYQMIRKLGSGGSGIVYLVRHLPTGQLRAAKVFRPDAQGSRMREPDVLRRLHHPALPQIFDILEAEGQTWLIMEYIAGTCLKNKTTWSDKPEQLFEIAERLAEVLLYLHTRNPPVLHLDIKPSNLFLRPDGRLVLIDFGASILQTDGCGENLCMGTRGFAAPEQADRTAGVDVRTDVYGYGATLYWLLYGRTLPEIEQPEDNGSPKRLQSCRRKDWEKRIRSLLRSESVGSAGERRNIRMLRKDRAMAGLEKRWRKLIARCVCPEKEDRFSDSALLYRSVCRARRRYQRQKKRRRAAAASAFLLAAVIFAGNVLWKDRSRQREEQKQTAKSAYEQLLVTAEGLGLEQAANCYREAALLQPGCYTWCDHFLDRILEDYCFEKQEEEALKELLYSVQPYPGSTVAEEMEENPEEYGRFACRLGTAYWYYYEGSGGKSAGTRWFERAAESRSREADSQEDKVKCGEKDRQRGEKEWFAFAEIHIKMGSYYEKLGRVDERGNEAVDFYTYWLDLKRLWELKGFEEESARIRSQIAQELLSGLVLHASELREAGWQQERLIRLLEELERYAKGETGVSEEGVWEAEELLELCSTAKEVLARTYGQESGKG